MPNSNRDRKPAKVSALFGNQSATPFANSGSELTPPSTEGAMSPLASGEQGSGSNLISFPGSAAGSQSSGGALAILERLGGIEGVLNTVTKVQSIMKSIQQFAPMIQLFSGLFAKKKAASAPSREGARRSGSRRRGSRKGKKSVGRRRKKSSRTYRRKGR